MLTELPHSEGQSAVGTPLLVDLAVGDPVSIELNAAANFDIDAERRELEQLFTEAGYRVVNDGGEVKFQATLLPPLNNQYDNLDSVPDEAFIRRVELAIKDGDRVVWLATREAPLIDQQNKWSAFVLPKVIKIPSNGPSCWRLLASGQFARAMLTRSYEQRHQEHVRFQMSRGPGRNGSP